MQLHDACVMSCMCMRLGVHVACRVACGMCMFMSTCHVPCTCTACDPSRDGTDHASAFTENDVPPPPAPARPCAVCIDAIACACVLTTLAPHPHHSLLQKIRTRSARCVCQPQPDRLTAPIVQPACHRTAYRPDAPHKVLTRDAAANTTR